jgi:LuxR family maltose regulon positive regulatory protein
LNVAADTCLQGLELADQAAQKYGRILPSAVYIYLVWGDLLRERNQLVEATRYLEQGLELGRRWRVDGETLRDGFISQARVRQAQGDLAGVVDALQRADELTQKHQAVPGFGAPVATCRARLALARALEFGEADSLDAVRNWAEDCGYWDQGHQTPEVPTQSIHDEDQHLVWARLLLADNKAGPADRLLAHLLAAAEGGGRNGRVIEILTVKALAWQALGDTEKALTTLKRALTMAEPEGYVRLFADEGRPMEALLRQLAARDRRPTYVDQLLAAMDVSREITRALPPDRPAVPLDPLSDREMEVLRLLSTDLSGPEIAAELVISLNTVKTHVKRIYTKLDVHSRFEAVTRATEIGLL